MARIRARMRRLGPIVLTVFGCKHGASGETTPRPTPPSRESRATAPPAPVGPAVASPREAPAPPSDAPRTNEGNASPPPESAASIPDDVFIAVDDAWTSCTADAQCKVVGSPCSTNMVIVHRRSVDAASRAYASACAGRPNANILGVLMRVECREGTCAQAPLDGDDAATGWGLGTGLVGPVPNGPRVEVRAPAGADQAFGAALHRRLKARVAQWRACYEAALDRDPKLEGSVDVSLPVGGDGEVVGAAVSGAGDQELHACWQRALTDLRLPAPSGGESIRVDVEFRLRPGPG